MIESKRALALDIIIPILAQRVVGADDDLNPPPPTSSSEQTISQPRAARIRSRRTVFPLSGSLTVVNCSSLYCLNAGRADWSREGSSVVRALRSSRLMSIFGNAKM